MCSNILFPFRGIYLLLCHATTLEPICDLMNHCFPSLNKGSLGPFGPVECEIGQTSPIGADWNGQEG